MSCTHSEGTTSVGHKFSITVHLFIFKVSSKMFANITGIMPSKGQTSTFPTSTPLRPIKSNFPSTIEVCQMDLFVWHL